MDRAVRLESFRKYISGVRTPVTGAKYSVAAAEFLVWLEGRNCLRLEQAPKTALSDYCLFLVEKGYATNTINFRIAAVNRFVQWCGSFGGMQLPEFLEPAVPRIHTKVKETLTNAQLSKFFATAYAELSEPVLTAAMLLPVSGLRCSEMSSLPLKSIRRITLTLADGRHKDTFAFLVRGKGGNERLVPILDEGVELVRRYLRGWRKNHPDTRWFFPGRKKQHLSDRSLREAIATVRGPQGLSYTSHTMRRTYLTRLHRMGVSPITLAKIAGHKNVQTLMDHYINLDAQDIARAVHGEAHQGSLKSAVE